MQQKQKIRCIDDCRENSLNDAFTSVESVSLGAMDHVVWSALICVLHQSVEMRLPDGTRLVGKLHEDWVRMSPSFKATTFDLKSAYKQLPVSPCDVSKAFVSLVCPETRQPRCFLMRALPFGAKSSVGDFNRVARLLWAIGCDLPIPWSNYFDDYPTLSRTALEVSTMQSVKVMMELLGFVLTLDELRPFAQVAEMLGVELDLSDPTSVRVGKKESRKLEVCQAVQHILESKQLNCRELPSMLGRMQFADLQVFGRAGRLAMSDIREFASGGTGTLNLDARALDALRIMQRRVCSGPPRTVSVDVKPRPVLVFTDGAFEPGNSLGEATIGGVILGKLWKCLAQQCPLRSSKNGAQRAKSI